MKTPLSILFSFLLGLTLFNANAQDTENNEIAFSQAQLEQMLAPIALYPDSVLTHILIASTYPLEVVQANRWVSQNPDMDADDALRAVETRGWDPSVKALVPFPQVLKRLSEDLDWTQQLGDAFLQDEKAVLAGIQSLRRKADQAGNLDKMEQMQVTREQDNIVIQPVEREVVYVPYYDTRVVYGPWGWADYPPLYWRHDYYRPYSGLYYWHPRVHIGFNFFFSAFNWSGRHIVISDHRYRRGHYYNRRQILRHDSARRWSHNPTHRRGVAYRSEPIRKRYNSNRVSQHHTRQIRAQEHAAVNSRKQGADGRKHSSDGRKSRVISTNRKNQPHLTRQEKLRSQISGEHGRQKAVGSKQGVRRGADHGSAKQRASGSGDKPQQRRSKDQHSGGKMQNSNVKQTDNRRSGQSTTANKTVNPQRAQPRSHDRQESSRGVKDNAHSRNDNSRTKSRSSNSDRRSEKRTGGSRRSDGHRR